MGFRPASESDLAGENAVFAGGSRARYIAAEHPGECWRRMWPIRVLVSRARWALAGLPGVEGEAHELG
jgi:hypothetical protein